MAPRALAGSVAALLALAAPASGAQKPITGKAPRGYTVIALAADGRARVAKAAPGFKIAPTAKVVTLHLRDRRGNYAGPVVVGGRSAKVIVAVRAGARVGRIAAKRGYGLARPAARATDRRRTARAKRGTPIGARNFGFVKSAARGRTGRGVDHDLDGVPGAFDVDDDGDLVLDNVDPTASAQAAAHNGDPVHPRWAMNIGLDQAFLAQRMGLIQGGGGAYALNQSAARPGDTAAFEQLRDLAMKTRGVLLFPLPATGTPELDCGAVPYCRRGGGATDLTGTTRFPDAFDGDGDGFGSMAPAGAFNPVRDVVSLDALNDPKKTFALMPHVGAADIGTGKTFIERSAGGDIPTTLSYVFGTVPAVAAVATPDGLLNATIGYPVAEKGPGTGPSPFQIHRYLGVSPGWDHYVDLRFWPPQRRGVREWGETADWIDIGGLRYTVVGRSYGPNTQIFRCPQNSYEALGVFGGAFVADSAGTGDLQGDRPTSPLRTMLMRVNVSRCLRDSGVLEEWTPAGRTYQLFVVATSSGGDFAEGGGIAFKAAVPATWTFPDGDHARIAWRFRRDMTRIGDIQLVVNQSNIDAFTPDPNWDCELRQTSQPSDTLFCRPKIFTDYPPDFQTRQPESAGGTLTLRSPADDNMKVILKVRAPQTRPSENSDAGYQIEVPRDNPLPSP